MWRRVATTGTEQRLTDRDRVSTYVVSPDGGLIAFATDTGGDEHWAIWVVAPDGSSERPITHDARRVHHLIGWMPDACEVVAFANLRDLRFFDVFAFPINGGQPRLLHELHGSGWRGAVLNDGSIVISAHRGRLQQHHLIYIDRDGLARQLTPAEPPATHDTPHAFGDGVLVLSNRGQDLTGVAYIKLDGSCTFVRTADSEVHSLVANGERWAYELSRDGFAEIHVVEDNIDRAIGGHPSGSLPSEKLIGQPMALGADGSLAFSLLRYDRPPSIYVAPPGRDATLVVPPSMEGVNPEELPTTELVEWPSFDGLEIPGFLLRPRAGGLRPTVVDVHGGPEFQSRPRWLPWTVALIAAGFNVLFPNVRGSTGYGWRYQSLDDVELRMNAVRDLDAAGDWLVREGIAPKAGIGVMGGSYGGYMTLAAIAFFPSRWSAAVDIFGVSDYVAQFEQIPAWRRPLREAEFGSLEHDRELLASISPANFTERIRTPLLVIHGANDSRISINQSSTVVEALRRLGRDVTFVDYGDEGHVLHRSDTLVDVVPRIVMFFEKHLVG